MSPDFHQPAFLFFLAMLLATVAAVAWSGRRPALHEGLLLLGFTYLALYARRGVPLFGIVAAPLLAAQLAAFPQGVQRGGPVGLALERLGTWLARRNRRYGRIDEAARGHAWPALALVGLLWLAAAQKRDGLVPLGVQFDPKLQPVAAAAYLEAHPPAGNGFNEQRWGGYLLHEFWPARRVFIDGELSVHTEWLARDYLRVVGLEPGWEDVLDRYGVQWVLYSTDSPLVRALAAAPGWQVAYQDQLATVLTREP
jgi:hypothetical protein